MQGLNLIWLVAANFCMEEMHIKL
uniref:Uncharacterized protein n=1 Tax=Rhizophora mucronata TaxID=61149 RepID=A0A2P2R333_RHIMU